jgi:hypothetical protein
MEQRIRRLAILGLVVALAGAQGCGKEEGNGGKGSASPPPEITGIAECDLYLHKSRECAAKTGDEGLRKSALDSIAKTEDGWKQAPRSTAAEKEALAEACQKMYDGAKKTSGSMCPGVY